MASETQWKQLCEGIARGIVGPFRQQNVTAGTSVTRDYLDNSTVVASMRVIGAATDTPSADCRRVYKIDKPLLDAVADIRILTDEDWAEWDEFDGDDEGWMAERGQV